MYNNQHQHQSQPPQLFEGLEFGDLARLIHPKLHIDEFKSKMGDDADIVILSFKVNNKEASVDLMNFIERGYDWVLDADVSAGELDDGEYLVFVELERTPRAPEQIVKLIEDILNLTEQDIVDWKFQYRKNPAEFELTDENLRKQIPLSPNNYISLYGDEEEVPPDEELSADEVDDELTSMQEAARVNISRRAPVNDFTESLRVFAGLK